MDDNIQKKPEDTRFDEQQGDGRSSDSANCGKSVFWTIILVVIISAFACGIGVGSFLAPNIYDNASEQSQSAQIRITDDLNALSEGRL